jgi:hypothetical protein
MPSRTLILLLGIAVSGGNYSGEYISFALPEAQTTTASATR